MSVARDGDVIRYTARRRWPGPRGKESTVAVNIGDQYSPGQLTDFDHYLTARWTLYGRWGRRLLMARAEHPPWTLHRARTDDWNDGLVEAAGLPPPTTDPVVHWSPGVDVRIGRPHWAS